METKQTTTVIVKNQKSVGLSLLLTFFFGPLGLLYSTVTGGIVMFLGSAVIALFTAGIGLLFTWPVCMVWGVISVNNYNKGLQL